VTIIEARGLRKVFGTNVALDNVNLQVDESRILGLIGPNGAGKTTALNAILGLTSFQGILRVLGRDPMDRARSTHAWRVLHLRCRRCANEFARRPSLFSLCNDIIYGRNSRQNLSESLRRSS
jgi:ABC-type branched-subunit amino acid transport system ATPase component